MEDKIDQNTNETMFHPFARSISRTEKCKRLQDAVDPDDRLAILINADPDSMSSALALKRLFWRKVKQADIYHINPIKRADNLALIKLLKINQQPIGRLKPETFTKWALLDSQPHHDEHFQKFRFDIIIDHHPIDSRSEAAFMDINEEYGANATIMTEYLRASKIRPSPSLATALFYGIKTDTDNFARVSIPNDINAFRYLYPFVNTNMIKKIESSEISKRTLSGFRTAIDNLIFIKDIAYIHMGRVKDPDLLVIIADFFLKMAEATWAIVTGIYGKHLIVIFRNVGFRLDAGKTAQKLFSSWGSAGGHKNAARAEISIQRLEKETSIQEGELGQFVQDKLKTI